MGQGRGDPWQSGPIATPSLTWSTSRLSACSMAQFLLDQGFQDVHNVVGGINAYSDIDPSVPKY